MSARSCSSPIAFPVLIDYWMGDAAGREERLEEHLFACRECAARLEELARLGAGVRAAFRSGTVPAVISAPFLEQLRSEGVRLREYRLAPGESVSCTIRGSDDFVVSRLSVDLGGVKRLDLFQSVDGGAELAMRDVPFDPAARELLVLPLAATLKRMPEHVARLRLVAADEAGERTIGEYTFNHSAEK
jgi:hypothetical protein